MNSKAIFIIGSILFVALIPSLAEAQPVRPVFTTTSLDGQLIGFELVDVQFGIWKPIISIAFGKNDSGIRFRYRGGTIIDQGIEIPVISQRLGDFSGAIVNWPATPVLGREGQSGVEMGFKFGETQYKGFIGELWPLGDDDFFTPVAFLSTDAFYSASLPYGIRISGSTETVSGIVLPQKEKGLNYTISSLFDQLSQDEVDWPFNSSVFSASIGVNGFRLSGRWGVLSNEASLKGFEFVTGVRGISQSLRGDGFWNLTLERNFTMYQTSIPVDLPEQFSDVPIIPDELPVKLAGKVFFQGGASMQKIEAPIEESDTATEQPGEAQQTEHEAETITETEMLFSWGISTTLTVYEFNVRAQIIFTQNGETKFSFSF